LLSNTIHESDLVPLYKIYEDEEKYESLIKILPPLEEAGILLEKYKLSFRDFYYTGSFLDRFCYWKFPTYLSLPIINEEFFSLMKIPELINEGNRILPKLLKEKNYKEFFYLMDDKIFLMVFNHLYWNISKEERYELFRTVYALLEYGHFEMNERILKDVFNHRTDKRLKAIRKELDKITKKSTITIYRGETEESTPYQNALSWTTSLYHAVFFANRYEIKGRLYQAEVEKENVLDYITGRNEQEVLVSSEDLTNIQLIEQVDPKEENQALTEKGYIEEFDYYETFIRASFFRKPFGIHGVNHTKRVLFLCLSLSHAYQLTQSERSILANCAIFHDTGRKHDRKCTEHGKWSVEKYLKVEDLSPFISLNAVTQLNKNEVETDDFYPFEREVTLFLMEYHAKGDFATKEAIKQYKTWSTEDKEMVWKLYEIFADADALDRVRFKQLNMTYLRTEEAKKRLLFANELIKTIREQ